ncbi:centromere/kinetochore protein zw10 homolog [Saccoglossus kowalevskii]|uniref:Centromere/kinetochore protein zw10 homolog n=1 Tax=Saccoglossus kowalevskii TaxID=10224 RepID=A0ABM0MYL1_SACKO|nr:PREDICTED: centromere/kinetochore protein zw10 homolog [Saccoglossus kowalevskii]
MASLVAEVLATSGGLEKEDFSTRMGKISNKVEGVKFELNSFITKKYADFDPTFVTTMDLHGKVESLTKEMTSLNVKIENDVSSQLSRSTSDFHDLSNQLQKTNAILLTLNVLLEVDEALQNFSTSLKEQEYMKACDLLSLLQEQMKHLKYGKTCKMKIVKCLETELRVNEETLIYSLSQAWTNAVIWKVPLVKDSHKFDSILTTQLKIAIGHKIQDVMGAMSAAKILNNRLQSFSKKLVDNLFRHLILFGNVEPKIETTYQYVVISLKRNGRGKGHIAPQQLYKYLLIVLDTIRKQFMNVKIEATENNTGVSLMKILGDCIWKDLSVTVINHCLVHSIPTSSTQLESYMEVIKATEEFEMKLAEWGFLTEGTSPLLTYARDVNVHFANKKCQDLIVKARSLMMTDLHNTVYIGDESPPEKLQKLHSSDARDEKTAIADKDVLSEGTLQLPKCQISQSVHQLMNVAYETLQEAVTSTTQCAIQLFYTVRNMFELFCDVVPTYHKQSLQELPQLSALHHNNCMYISHHLLTMGHQYKNQLPSPLCDGAATFVDMVPIFRKLATDCFLQQMRIQRTQMMESLSGASGFIQVEEDDNRKTAEKAIKQVLHQLNHLSRVWNEVLPSSVYVKAMSTLINTALLEIINKVTALEDISVDDSDQLKSLFTIIVDKAPPLLQLDISEEVYPLEVHVNQWRKFNELIIVLEASLQEIEDRWTDGKARNTSGIPCAKHTIGSLQLPCL